MCECANFLQLLNSYESRILSGDTNHPKLRRNEVDITYNFILSWPGSQCMCCFRNGKNFERFNLVVQSIICLMLSHLKNIQTFLDNASPSKTTPSTEPAEVKVVECVDGQPSRAKRERRNSDEKRDDEEECLSLTDLEQILILMSKAFLLNFPLYVACKHSAHQRLDDLTATELQSLGVFCDLHDSEVPAFLLRNVALFCNGGGFAAMTQCFERPNLPVTTAHAITATLSNVKLWLNYQSILKLFYPLRIKVLQYMCELSDTELRSPATKAMAEFMWTAIKDPLEAHVTFDTDGLQLAFKYFTSTTLTMRLAGISQINAHINLFNEICTSETIAEIEVMGQKLADWLTENQIINHLFGPNLHIEVVKQSHIILNFLAVENYITESHIELIWQAAQLKHCSKTVYDILPSLVKNLAMRPALHLYSLLCRLDPREHNEQSIFIVSALTKFIWSRDTCRPSRVEGLFGVDCLLRAGSGLNVMSSTDNSLSIGGGNNSDDEPGAEYSSEERKSSHAERSGKRRGSLDATKEATLNVSPDTTKLPPTDEDPAAPQHLNTNLKKGADYKSSSRRAAAAAMLIDNSSSEECGGRAADQLDLYRRKHRKKKKAIKSAALRVMDAASQKQSDDFPQVISEADSLSDNLPINMTGPAEEESEDCSDSDNHAEGSSSSPLNKWNVHTFAANLMDSMSHEEGGKGGTSSYSSPTSNKSEKNMGDFDDEEESANEEQLQEMAASLRSFPVNRAQPSAKTLPQDPDSSILRASAAGVGVNGPSSSYKYHEICEPKNMLLWNLLQDATIGQLGEHLASEAEKALATLLCFNTDKFIRTRFIEACLSNLANHESVVVSLRLLPKLFASFQQFRSSYSHYVSVWAERQHKMMSLFFADVKHYGSGQGTVILKQNGAPFYNHMTQVQMRLQFLTYIFSGLGSPDTFRLSVEQVDDLWDWLANDAECADCLFAWLQSQTKTMAAEQQQQHALGVEALQHLYNHKLPALQPEGISMVALGLFQQLCSLARHYEQLRDDNALLDIGMAFLWKIALKATNTDVSMTAIQYINTYYLGQQLKLEDEFIMQCMNHLTLAVNDLTGGDEHLMEGALMCIQRALMLLSSHLEAFRRKYAYHLRSLQLEGHTLTGGPNALNADSQGVPLRIVIQPAAGVPEKHVLHVFSLDLVGELKAEITNWWRSAVQARLMKGGAVSDATGLEGPLRIITQGQEITAEYDERTLAEVNFKDNQIVYVSLGGRHTKRKDALLLGNEAAALAPLPQCIPTVLLLQPKYFEQLFQLMQILDDMTTRTQTTAGSGGVTLQPHPKAQQLSRRVWEILAQLPNNPEIMAKYTRLGRPQSLASDKAEHEEDADRELLDELYDTTNLQKFMYSMQVLESFCKNRISDSATASLVSNRDSGGMTEGNASFNDVNHLKSIQRKLATIEQLKQSISILHANQFNRSSGVSGIQAERADGDDEMSGGGKMIKCPMDVPELKELKMMQQLVGATAATTSDEAKGDMGAGSSMILDEDGVRLDYSDDSDSSSTVMWLENFIKRGGFRALFRIFMTGRFQRRAGQLYSEWRHDCLANLMRVICIIGLEDVRPDDNYMKVPRINECILAHMPVQETLRGLSSILCDSALPLYPNSLKTGFWCRAQVVQFALNLLVCFVHSSKEARQQLWSEIRTDAWLEKLILNESDPAVRRETCAGLYRICLGDVSVYLEMATPLIRTLIRYLPKAEQMRNCYNEVQQEEEPAKELFGPACRDYFWLLCRLMDVSTVELLKPHQNEVVSCLQRRHIMESIDLEALCGRVADGIVRRDYVEATGRCVQDDGLVGLLNLMVNLLKFDPHFKYAEPGQQLLDIAFQYLFEVPVPETRCRPKCKSQAARAATYDLMVELCKKAPQNYVKLHAKLMHQHCFSFHAPYPWDYWPRDDGRAECGYVGLTNLGATCYMASCIQHLYMMPQARQAVLQVRPDEARKHGQMLQELQRMFAYLLESERKTYNPRSFCRAYQMDHQPLNTGEQKDMAEFFIDLVSKLEEMTPELKRLVKRLFCGILSNNVVSLDCEHVSRNIEEFYTVRCQVADMRNLYESLDEVTVKDTLDGDNMYTCSQCGKKVRAEKRACFRSLPQILCFNTMRYTFNMVTMLKEKVNTHFSFPMRINMRDYVEKNLMPQQHKAMEEQEQEAKDNKQKLTDGDGDKEAAESEQETAIGSAAAVDEYEYDLVGVTVHTGTADGGHYYSFIKERDADRLKRVAAKPNDRWLLFNDAEVKVFDSTQIATECFGGETTSKTYDSTTEKYLDFSYEKTNSAYMLFYERINRAQQKGADDNSESGPSTNSCSTTITTDVGLETPKGSALDREPLSEMTGSPAKAAVSMDVDEKEKEEEERVKQEKEKAITVASPDKTGSNNDITLVDANEDNNNINNNSPPNVEIKCDIDVKDIGPQASGLANPSNGDTAVVGPTAPTIRLNRELEDWIWQDNKQFLQDRNIFEHTYFNFMSQICGQITSTLASSNTVYMSVQLSVSFFLETFIHAKEKPTMVVWVELLTKQFNANEEACEWFLSHMATEPWWTVQVLIQCPNQMVRQMFQRLVIHVIQRLRPTHHMLYEEYEGDEANGQLLGSASCVTKFIRSLLMLLENGAKQHQRHLSEFFGLLYEFARMGEEEALFMLEINVIRSVVDFYLGHKSHNNMDNNTASDIDGNSSDEAFAVDTVRPASLEKMIALVALLTERSRGADLKVNLSARDYVAIASGKGLPFLYQQIRDNINPHQTRNLIYALCRYDERLASQIVTMLFNAVTKHTELCGPFFKLLSLLTETTSSVSGGSSSGMPCFSQLILTRVWDAAEYCPQSALDWLALQAPRNKIAHAWILQTTDSWVEPFLFRHNNARVRYAAAFLLISLVPSQAFRANYRVNQNTKMVISCSSTSTITNAREINHECQTIIHKVLETLLGLLRAARVYTDIEQHGTTKLTAYFNLMTYLMVSKTEKLMLGPHIKELWDLFHPRLSEPSVAAHYNKQALLSFWYHSVIDCPENTKIVVSIPEITRNIAFNYILADHEESEIVAYNRAMLPVYYGLLRVCCQQSRLLTRQLAAHQNLQWAFKNITPHPTQYPQAVDELFRLMALFTTRHDDVTDLEDKEITIFRRTTLTAFLTTLDARVSWGTLIAALRILVENDEDRLFIVYHGGLAMIFEALQTLHAMYHEATACHVSGDLQELLAELLLLARTLGLLERADDKKRMMAGVFKGVPEGCRRLVTLLNTYNPPEMRNLTMDVLKELVRYQTAEVINSLVPILLHCHATAQSSNHFGSQLGVYFPRTSAKNIWAQTKSTPRPPRPMVQMAVPPALVMRRGQRKEYYAALDDFYKPYHDFLDIMFRMAVNTNQLFGEVVKLSCLSGIEGAMLHFNFFPKFWVGIYNNKQTNKYVDLVVNCPLLVDVVDTMLRDVRVTLNDAVVLSFVETYYPKVTSKLDVIKMLDEICSSLTGQDDLQVLSGDALAIRVIVENVARSWSPEMVAAIKAKVVEFRKYVKHLDWFESPPRKRRKSTSEGAMAADQPVEGTSTKPEEKMSTIADEENGGTSSAMMDQQSSSNNNQEPPKNAESSIAEPIVVECDDARKLQLKEIDKSFQRILARLEEGGGGGGGGGGSGSGASGAIDDVQTDCEIAAVATAASEAATSSTTCDGDSTMTPSGSSATDDHHDNKQPIDESVDLVVEVDEKQDP